MQISPETSITAGSATEADKSSSKEKSSSLKNSSKTASKAWEGEEGELEQEKSERSVADRFLKWTSEDVFDWNPKYTRTARGILTVVHIVLSALVMTLVGSGCSSGAFIFSDTLKTFTPDNSASFFYCHSSAAFMFVVATSAFIQSTLLLGCCLLSKKGDVIIHGSALELIYYIVYGLLFFIAGLALESNLRSKDKGRNAIAAGGVFGIINSILYLVSAVWNYMYFRKHFGDRDGK